MVALIPIVMIVVGALVFALSSNAKVAELGKLTCAAGLFALAFAFAGSTVHLLGK